MDILYIILTVGKYDDFDNFKGTRQEERNSIRIINNRIHGNEIL